MSASGMCVPDARHCMQDAKQDALAFHSQLAAMRASEMEVSARLRTELRYVDAPLCLMRNLLRPCEHHSEEAPY